MVSETLIEELKIILRELDHDLSDSQVSEIANSLVDLFEILEQVDLKRKLNN